jgi:hypothetical protein
MTMLDPNEFARETEHVEPARELTTEEKIDYLFDTALKIRSLIDKITDQDVQKAKAAYQNPFMKHILDKALKS